MSVGGVLLAGGIGFWFLVQSGLLFPPRPFSGPTWTVRSERLKVTIVARGNLESAKNGDIVCTVRSGTKGSTSASTIKWLIDLGTEVKKGDKVIELDSSGFQNQLQDQSIKVDQAKAAFIQADEDYRIQELDNTTEIEKAKNALELANIDLEKYIKGDFVQALKDVDGRIETARSDLESWNDRAAWTQRMVKKGLMSKVQSEADNARVEGARFAVQKVVEERRVLVDFMQRRTVQDLNAKLSEAKRDVEKASSLAKAKLAQKEAERLAKNSIYQQEVTKKKDLEEEIAKCTILAPQDGLVVYYVPEQAMRGGGSQQSTISQGEPVREGQKLMQIPDLSHMLVNVRVPEAMVAHLHSETDPDDESTWQLAQVKVDAYSSRILKGHIKTVDTMASQQDWFASDVKVYKTMVAIDTEIEGLKPGMSAEVTIYADESKSPVLVVPVQSVLGTISMGVERKCFVLDENGQPKLRDIVVGMSNERVVEVKPWDESKQTGLKEGEKVVQNPRTLLREDSDLKPGKARSKNNEDDNQGPGGEAGKKGGKKKGGAGKGPGGAPDSNGKQNGATQPPGKQAGGNAPSQQQMQAFIEKMRSSTPELRRDFINNIPDAAARDKTRQWLKSQGLEVAD